MADTGWVIATSYNNVAGSDTDWVSQTAMLTPAGTTDYLACTGFGLSVSGLANIDGIEVKIGRQKSFGTGNVRDYEIKLWHFTSAGLSSNKADTGTNWPGSMTDATYGGATELWGKTWDSSNTNDSSFGVYIKANEVGGTGAATAVVGDVYVKVYYTLADLTWVSALLAHLASTSSQVTSGNASGGIGSYTGRSSSRHVPIGY